MKPTLLRLPATAACLALIFSMQGCSSDDGATPPREMGKVTGKATLDGKPMVGVEIIFTPETGGGSSSGAMDEKGNYSLEYSGGGRIGAVVGSHIVSFRDDAEEMVGDEAIPGGGEDGGGTIPQKYQDGSSTIKREVATGEQVIDFELTSK
ncbi:MAG: hypothetical protein ABGZ53_38030 [Fuerstiella sp.]